MLTTDSTTTYTNIELQEDDAHGVKSFIFHEILAVVYVIAAM
jgi:hypothetical protein